MTERNLRGLQPLRPDELGDGDDRELRDALRTGRALDAAIDDVPMRVPEDFTHRVMAAVSSEPVPGPVGFMTPLRRRGGLAGFGESVRQAWAAIGSRGVPSFARATALAYVLVVAIAGAALAGVATVGVGSALGLFGPTAPTPAPTAVPLPTQDGRPTPGPQTAPVPTTEPGESEHPSDEPDASDDHGGGSNELGDDHGGNSGPGSSSSSDGSSGSDDGSSSSSGSGETATPRPTDTPRPTGTPKPTQTAH